MRVDSFKFEKTYVLSIPDRFIKIPLSNAFWRKLIVCTLQRARGWCRRERWLHSRYPFCLFVSTNLSYFTQYKQSDYTVYIQCLRCDFIVQIFIENTNCNQVLMLVPQKIHNPNKIRHNKKSMKQTPAYPPSWLQVIRAQHRLAIKVTLFFHLIWKSFCSIKTTSIAALFTRWHSDMLSLFVVWAQTVIFSYGLANCLCTVFVKARRVFILEILCLKASHHYANRLHNDSCWNK